MKYLLLAALIVVGALQSAFAHEGHVHPPRPLPWCEGPEALEQGLLPPDCDVSIVRIVGGGGSSELYVPPDPKPPKKPAVKPTPKPAAPPQRR